MEEQKEKSENLENNVQTQEVKTEEVKTSTTINYEDLIAKARMDEKNKLYPEIEKWKRMQMKKPKK